MSLVNEDLGAAVSVGENDDLGMGAPGAATVEWADGSVARAAAAGAVPPAEAPKLLASCCTEASVRTPKTAAPCQS